MMDASNVGAHVSHIGSYPPPSMMMIRVIWYGGGGLDRRRRWSRPKKQRWRRIVDLSLDKKN
jgi:hypothetical protein